MLLSATAPPRRWPLHHELLWSAARRPPWSPGICLDPPTSGRANQIRGIVAPPERLVPGRRHLDRPPPRVWRPHSTLWRGTALRSVSISTGANPCSTSQMTLMSPLRLCHLTSQLLRLDSPSWAAQLVPPPTARMCSRAGSTTSKTHSKFCVTWKILNLRRHYSDHAYPSRKFPTF